MSAGACASAAVWGTAKNTTSHESSGASSWAVNAKSVHPMKFGYTSSIRFPASSFDVAAMSSNSGCPMRLRTTSMPANPAAPTTPTFMLMRLSPNLVFLVRDHRMKTPRRLQVVHRICRFFFFKLKYGMNEPACYRAVHPFNAMENQPAARKTEVRHGIEY